MLLSVVVAVVVVVVVVEADALDLLNSDWMMGSMYEVVRCNRS